MSIFKITSESALFDFKIGYSNMLDTEVFTLGSKIVSEMFFLTKPRNDIFAIIGVLPKHETTFALFEVISINIDNSLYDFIHLPEWKLYYPEPFVASPNFIHEEV